MSIKPQRQIEARENKGFHAETIIDFESIPYDSSNLSNELSAKVVHSGNYFNADDWTVEVADFNQLKNPNEKNPISIAEFLGKYLDLTSLRSVFESRYGKLDYHHRFPLEAMIKASMIRRIKSMRSFQKLVNVPKENKIKYIKNPSYFYRIKKFLLYNTNHYCKASNNNHQYRNCSYKASDIERF